MQKPEKKNRPDEEVEGEEIKVTDRRHWANDDEEGELPTAVEPARIVVASNYLERCGGLDLALANVVHSSHFLCYPKRIAQRKNVHGHSHP